MDEEKKVLGAEPDEDIEDVSEDLKELDDLYDDATEDDTQEDAVDSQDEEGVNEEEKPKKQPRAEQTAYAKLRKQAEADVQKKTAERIAALEAKLAEQEAKKQATADEAKWEQEAEEAGLPVEFYKNQKRLELEISELKKQKEEGEKTQTAAQKDLSDFKAKFPNIDINQVIKSDNRFNKFARNRLGAEPLIEIWQDFTEIIGETETRALQKAVSRASRGTDSSSGGSRVILTAAQQQSLEDWNKSVPESLRMTAKEYLKRLKGD